MRTARFAALALWGLGLLPAADFSTYRGLRLGMSVAAAEEQSGMRMAEPRTVHREPALLQELDWQPKAAESENLLTRSESVRDGVLSFYNGELYRVAITYDRYQVEGLTAADITEAISKRYGPATAPTATISYHSVYGETADVLARWEDADASYNLIRTGDRSSYSLILSSKRLDPLAAAAKTEALRLEALDAPRRDAERQKKREADAEQLLEDARKLHKPQFQP